MDRHLLYRQRTYGFQQDFLSSAAYPAYNPTLSSYIPQQSQQLPSQYTAREHLLLNQPLGEFQNPLGLSRKNLLTPDQYASTALPMTDLYLQAPLSRSALEWKSWAGERPDESTQYALRQHDGRLSPNYGSVSCVPGSATEPYRKRAQIVENQRLQNTMARTTQAAMKAVQAGGPRSDEDLAREVRLLHKLWERGASGGKSGGKASEKAQANAENRKDENRGVKSQKRSQRKRKSIKQDKVYNGTQNKPLVKSIKDCAPTWDSEEGVTVSVAAAGDADAWGIDMPEPESEIPSHDEWESAAAKASQNGEDKSEEKPITQNEKPVPHHPDVQKAASKAFREFLGSASDMDDDSEDDLEVAGSDDDLEIAETSQCGKGREEVAYNFFMKLFEENQELQKMYKEKCNCGTFECLVCVGIGCNLIKRFGDLVSLVMHSRKILRTKKRPEHRGYGRAICALLGWDPSRNPVLQNTTGLRPRGCIPPHDNLQEADKAASQENEADNGEDKKINAKNGTTMNLPSKTDMLVKDSGLEETVEDVQGFNSEENARAEGTFDGDNDLAESEDVT